MKRCIICEKEHLLTGKTCSPRCRTLLGNKKRTVYIKHSEQTKEKLSVLFKLPEIKVIKKCKRCDKEFEVVRKIKNNKESIPKKEKQYCSKRCCCMQANEALMLKIKVSKKIVTCERCFVEFELPITVTQNGHYCENCKPIRKKICQQKRRNGEMIGKKHNVKRYYKRICKNCNVSFSANKISTKFCCVKCFINTPLPKRGGLRDGGGHSKVYLYESHIAGSMKLNNDEIQVAKILDSLKLNWIRNTKGFPYVSLENKNRNYYPDFYIKDFDVFVEYKGFVTKEMDHKMKNAVNDNKFKLLIIYGNSKRYRDLGLNLKQITENNESLLIEIKNTTLV